MCAEHIGLMTRHCTAYESKHRTLKTTYQEMIILVNRVRHPRVQGKFEEFAFRRKVFDGYPMPEKTLER